MDGFLSLPESLCSQHSLICEMIKVNTFGYCLPLYSSVSGLCSLFGEDLWLMSPFYCLCNIRLQSVAHRITRAFIYWSLAGSKLCSR